MKLTDGQIAFLECATSFLLLCACFTIVYFVVRDAGWIIGTLVACSLGTAWRIQYCRFTESRGPRHHEHKTPPA